MNGSLPGEQGETRQKMLAPLVALGKVFGAERLVADPERTGKWRFLQNDWEGTVWNGSTVLMKGRSPGCPDPIGMPRGRWEEMGIDADFAGKQQAVVAAYERLGVMLECTCTPITARDLVWRSSGLVRIIGGKLCKFGYRRPHKPGRPVRVHLPRLSPERHPFMVFTSMRTGSRRYHRY